MINLCIGIVLYNPDIKRLRENIEAIYCFEKTIVLVDNGSKNIEEIKSLLKDYSKVALLQNYQNLGIARALNQIAEFGKDMKCEWILTLDQDSVCPNNILVEYEQYISKNEVGMVCPKIYDINSDIDINEKSHSSEVMQCITSASMIKLEAWEKVNGFDESMFIDGVDFDICQRIRSCGYRIYRANNVLLKHEIGKITIRKFLLFDVIVKNHSAFRKYYIARNTMYLARKTKSKSEILKAYLRVIKQAVIVCIYEDNKTEKLKNICIGLGDGCKCRLEERWII